MSRPQRFLRLRTSILDSSLLLEELPTRWLFLTMLILADDAETGIVDMPVERLAAQAALSVEQTRIALERLCLPDGKSRSQLEGGQRIVPLEREPGMEPRGWRLVNWAEMKREAQREAAASRKQRSRGHVLSRSVTRGHTPSQSVTPRHEQSHEITPEAEAEAEQSRVRIEKNTNTTPSADALVDIWNGHRGPMRQCRGLGEAREAATRKRLKQFPDLSRWQAAIERAATSAFCSGQVEPSDGHRRFLGHFDWLIGRETLLKIEEGYYDDDRSRVPETFAEYLAGQDAHPPGRPATP